MAALISLLLLAIAIFLVWWRLLYRKLSPVAAVFARISRLGAWAGAPPSRANTPDEYVEQLGTLVPAQRSSLRALGEMYDRERWGRAADDSARAPLALYARVRAAIAPLIVRRARALPLAALRRLSRVRRRGGDER